MNLLDISRERIKVLAIMKFQQPGLVTKGVEEYRLDRLRMLNSHISNLINNLGYGNNTQLEYTDRQTGLDRPENKERSGDNKGSMGALEFKEAGAEKGCNLCGW